MTDICGRRATARIHAPCSVAGSSTAITWGRKRRIAARTSIANSSLPGATGKYVKRPRDKPPASAKGSGIGGSISADITQSFLSEHLYNRDLQGLGFVRALRREAFQLDRVTRHIDAV